MIRYLIVLSLLLAATALMFGKDAEVDLKPLMQALDSTNLFTSQAAPFTVTAEITLHKLAKGDEKGSYRILWQSPTDWRRDIKTATFQSSEGVLQGAGWEMNNTGWPPLRIVQVEDVRQAYAAILEMAKNGKSSEKKSKQNTCWRFEEKDELPMEVCVSNGSGTIESMIFKNVYYTFKDYKDALGKKFPGGLKVNSLAQDVAELKNIQVAPLPNPPAEPLPQGAWKAPAVACLLPPAKVTHKVAPLYPAMARMNNEVGVVTVGAMVGPDGRVTATVVLQTATPSLDSAAQDSVKTWQFEPVQCGGNAIEHRTDVSIQFNPQHTDLSKGSLPLYH
jgi:TonB family protein